MLEENRTSYHNKQALESMGIVNYIKNVTPRTQQLETDNNFLKKTLTKTINKVSELQQSNNAMHSSNTPSDGADKAEEMSRKISSCHHQRSN